MLILIILIKEVLQILKTKFADPGIILSNSTKKISYKTFNQLIPLVDQVKTLKSIYYFLNLYSLY